MSSFSEQVTDLAVIDNMPTVAFEPPRMWWHNGIKQAKTSGSFYTRASEFPNGLPTPWASDDRFEGEQGYSTSALKVAVLAKRTQAFVKPAEQGQPVEWLTKWRAGASVYTELLCLIEGYDGPVVWAAKGLTGKSVSEILRSYENGLLKEASRVAKRALPLWAFWLPISSKRLADGKPAYEDTGYGSWVTPPALVLPEQAMDALYVGNDLIATGSDIWNEHASWSKFQRLPENTVEGEVVQPLQIAAPGRNVPQLVEADDTY